jgi:hypothetical protein
MAKFTIEITDMPNGGVNVVSSPSNETMFKKIASHGPDSLTSAEAYGMYACRMMREKSKETGKIVTLVPGIGR